MPRMRIKVKKSKFSTQDTNPTAIYSKKLSFGSKLAGGIEEDTHCPADQDQQ